MITTDESYCDRYERNTKTKKKLQLYHARESNTLFKSTLKIRECVTDSSIQVRDRHGVDNNDDCDGKSTFLCQRHVELTFTERQVHCDTHSQQRDGSGQSVTKSKVIHECQLHTHRRQHFQRLIGQSRTKKCQSRDRPSAKISPKSRPPRTKCGRAHGKR